MEDAEKMVPTDEGTDEDATAPPGQAQALQRWNESSVNIFRFFSTMYSFILMGMTDGAVGVCSPSSPEHNGC